MDPPNSANPHGLKRAEGGRRDSIDRQNPEMARFWARHDIPGAFAHNGPISGGFEEMYWRNEVNKFQEIRNGEMKALNPKPPSAMDMHWRMQDGKAGSSPLMESIVRDLPKDSRDFMNGTHKFTPEDLAKEFKPRQPTTFGGFRFGGDAPPPPMRAATPEPPEERVRRDSLSPIQSATNRPSIDRDSQGCIIIPDF